MLLLAITAPTAALGAQSQIERLRAENAALRKLVTELSSLSKQLTADLAAQRLVIEKIEKDKQKAAAEHRARALEYKLAAAENKMLKARIKSLVRSTGSSTTKPSSPRSRRNMRTIQIELHEDFWEWWTDPMLLSKHIALRRKLVHLDADHSIDAWLTRRKQFAGVKVDWTMQLVSGAITSKEKVDDALKKADRELNSALEAAVFGRRFAKATDNAKYRDATIAALATTQPKPRKTNTVKVKTPKTADADPYARKPRVDHRKHIRDLQERIELYKRASKAGGLTTIYAVAGDIAAKIAIPGRHFEKIPRTPRPQVQITGFILGAAPKAGYFAGRTDRMMQFSISGSCTLKGDAAPELKTP